MNAGIILGLILSSVIVITLAYPFLAAFAGRVMHRN